MPSGGAVPPWDGGCYRNETSYEPWPGKGDNNNNDDDSNADDNGNRNDNGYHPDDITASDPGSPWWTWDTFHQRTSVMALSANDNTYTDDQLQIINTALNQMSDDPYKILINTLLDSLRPPDPQAGSMIRLPTPEVVAFLQACSAAGRCNIAAVPGDRWTRIVNSADYDDEAELDLTVDIVDGNDDVGSIGILNLGVQTDCASTGCDGIDVSDDTSDDSWADTNGSPSRAWELLVDGNSYVMFDMRSVAINDTDIVLPVYIFDPWA